MTIPYHEHTMQIATASKEDINAGVATNKFVTPAALGTAAAANKEDFISKEHLATINKAVPNSCKIIAGIGLSGGGSLTKDITIALHPNYLDAIERAGIMAADTPGKLKAILNRLEEHSLILRKSIVTTGAIILMANQGASQGENTWLSCNGWAVSRKDYERLFSVIGEEWGKGDGSTTFNVPDLSEHSLHGKGANSFRTVDYYIKT